MSPAKSPPRILPSGAQKRFEPIPSIEETGSDLRELPGGDNSGLLEPHIKDFWHVTVHSLSSQRSRLQQANPPRPSSQAPSRRAAGRATQGL
jgi:hypothetical protein